MAKNSLMIFFSESHSEKNIISESSFEKFDANESWNKRIKNQYKQVEFSTDWHEWREKAMKFSFKKTLHWCARRISMKIISVNSLFVLSNKSDDDQNSMKSFIKNVSRTTRWLRKTFKFILFFSFHHFHVRRFSTLENEQFNVLTMKTNKIKQFVNLLKWLKKEKRKDVEMSNFGPPNWRKVLHTETNFENNNGDLFIEDFYSQRFVSFSSF